MILVLIIIIILGLALGSFINALVWRMHEQEQLIKNKSTKQAKYKNSLSIIHGRSMCIHCHQKLRPIDLVPVLSWVFLKGKCRYCQHNISLQYPLVELITVGLFIFSYFFWPLGFHSVGLLEFIVWLILIVGFMALTIYDLKWLLLPDKIVYPLIGLVIIQIIIVSIFYSGGAQLLLTSFWGLLIGGGIFLLLFIISKGAWIGGGDIKLGALLGLIVGGPFASILLIFTASLIGTLATIPLLTTHRLHRKSYIPFGPFLIVGVIIVRLFGSFISVWIKNHYLIS